MYPREEQRSAGKKRQARGRAEEMPREESSSARRGASSRRSCSFLPPPGKLPAKTPAQRSASRPKRWERKKAALREAPQTTLEGRAAPTRRRLRKSTPSQRPGSSSTSRSKLPRSILRRADSSRGSTAPPAPHVDGIDMSDRSEGASDLVRGLHFSSSRGPTLRSKLLDASALHGGGPAAATSRSERQARGYGHVHRHDRTPRTTLEDNAAEHRNLVSSTIPRHELRTETS